MTSEKEVLVTSIDDFFEKNQLGKIDFIKIDVEGAETKVLDGMNRTFGSGERPLMMIEMSGGERFREEAKAIHNRLARLGYTSHLFDRGLPEVDVLRLGNRFHGNVLWNYQHSNLSAQRRDS